MISDLNERSREIFRQIVQTYLDTGAPVGSRTLSRSPEINLSPASIRNVMADLEDLGVLYAPHPSAGRMPTDKGLRLYVDGLLEVGGLTRAERGEIEAVCAASGGNVESLLSRATTTLAGLAQCAGLVAAPNSDLPVKHMEFVPLNPGRVLVVIIRENGVVENRIIQMPEDLPASTLIEAGNFLSQKLRGHNLREGVGVIDQDLKNDRVALDALTRKVVEAGLATWVGDVSDADRGSLIVRGQAHLLEDVSALSDLERIRELFDALETKETMLKLLELTDLTKGVQIFIGADNPLFREAGCSMVVAPFRDGDEKIIGAIGVIGPTRINYARIIPMVDFTSKIIGRLIG